jgi:hypothetical protein
VLLGHFVNILFPSTPASFGFCHMAVAFTVRTMQ